jgi:hypothetical protein
MFCEKSGKVCFVTQKKVVEADNLSPICQYEKISNDRQ